MHPQDLQENQTPCPNCGYCRHCGRGGHYTYPWGVYPQYPWYTWTGVNTGGSGIMTYPGLNSGTITISEGEVNG